MHLRRPFGFLLALALCAVAALAQVTVSKSGGGDVGVDLSGVSASGGPAAQLALRTLRSNLDRSGWMKVVPPAQASLFVRGQIQESAGRVQFACTATNALGQVYLNATYAQSVPHAVTVAHQAANDVVVRATGKPTFFLARLVLIGVRNGRKELFLADSSAQALTQLTRDGSTVLKPRWSFDNRLISYTSHLSKWADVYTIELATGVRKREAAYPGMNTGGAISPDGRSMALILSKDGNPDLYVKDLPSGRVERLTNTPRANEGSPVWSPDGSRIAYVSDSTGTRQIYSISRASRAVERLTTSGRDNLSPDWGANGLVAYQTLVGGKYQIAYLDPLSKQSVVVTPHDASYEDPSWAPDGRHLVAARSVNYSSSVYLLDTMGGQPVALATSGDWYAPAWSR
jgi:TolB protein